VLSRLRQIVHVRPCRLTHVLLLLGVLGMKTAGSPAALRAADLESTALAKELMGLMATAHLDAIATKDPVAEDRFVAALAYADVQLLVIAARYPSPPVLDQLLTTGAYRDAYGELQGAAIPESKLFVHDLGADGLHADRGQSVDIVYEQATKETMFDGSASKRDKLAKIDAQYCQMLALLIRQVRTASAIASGTSSRNR